MNAVYQNAGSERVLVIRGISDMSDERKAQLDRVGSFRGLAMKNSLRVLKALLKAGRFERAQVGAEEPQIAAMSLSSSAPQGLIENMMTVKSQIIDTYKDPGMSTFDKHQNVERLQRDYCFYLREIRRFNNNKLPPSLEEEWANNSCSRFTSLNR